MGSGTVMGVHRDGKQGILLVVGTEEIMKEGTEEDGGVILHVELPIHGHFDPGIDLIL